MKALTAVVWAISVAVLIQPAFADTIGLRDGRTLEGEIIRRTAGDITIMTSTGVSTYQLIDLDDATRKRFMEPAEPTPPVTPPVAPPVVAAPAVPVVPEEIFVTRKGQKIVGKAVTIEELAVTIQTSDGITMLSMKDLDTETQDRLLVQIGLKEPPVARWFSSKVKTGSQTNDSGRARRILDQGWRGLKVWPWYATTLFAAGLLLTMFAHLWMIFVAFSERVLWGFAVLCTGIGTLLFIGVHWEVAWPPLKYYLIGFALIIASGIVAGYAA